MTQDKTTGLLIIDVQEKLFPSIERNCEVLDRLMFLVRGMQILELPVLVTEQENLGSTLDHITNLLPANYPSFQKSHFSCLEDPAIRHYIEQSDLTQWVLCGLETHICVYQTARDLRLLGKDVLIANDATSSRSIFDFSTAIAEMRDLKVRISCTELILFELLKSSHSPYFPQMLALLKDVDSLAAV